MSEATPLSIRPRTVVISLLTRADRFADDGQIDHAAAFYRAAVAADQTPIARIAYACFLADCEREVLARTHLIEAWELSKRLRLPEVAALACHNLAALSRRQGHTAAADSYQQQAIRAALEVDTVSLLPPYLVAGRGLDLIKNESAVADRLLCATRHDLPEEIAALHNSGVIASRQGRDSLAIERLYAAFDRAEKAKDLTACAAILVTIAQVQRDRGRWSVASECLQLAESIDRHAGRIGRANSLQKMREELAQGLGFLSVDPNWN